MINQVKKGKSKTEKPALMVMHTVDKNTDGTFSIASNAPKLKEAVDSAKLPKIQKPSTVGIEKDSKLKDKPKEVPKGQISDEQRLVLRALHDLGGKDVHSMDIAKNLGFDKTHKNAPRAPVRDAMEALHALHLVTSKKEGARYSFSITDKGKEALTAPQVKDKKHDPDDVPDHMLNEAVRAKAKAKGGDPLPQPSTSERPANTDIRCGKCGVYSPWGAIHCKECGAILRPEQAETVKVAA